MYFAWSKIKIFNCLLFYCPAAVPEEMVATLDTTTTEAGDSSTNPAGEPPARGEEEAVLGEKPGADGTGHTNILCYDKN